MNNNYTDRENAFTGKSASSDSASTKSEALKLITNIPKTLTFKYAEPKIGMGNYGEWHMYAVIDEGVDKVFFPSKTLHNKIQGKIQQSNTLVITKKDVSINGKIITQFDCETPLELGDSVKKFISDLENSSSIDRQNNQDKVWEQKDVRMARMSALKSAVEITKDENKVFVLAEEMFNWIYGIRVETKSKEIIDNKTNNIDDDGMYCEEINFK